MNSFELPKLESNQRDQKQRLTEKSKTKKDLLYFIKLNHKAKEKMQKKNCSIVLIC
jgi:hypothetical protein